MAMTVSEETFKRIALEDPEGHWELHYGHLRQKPGMSLEHNQIMFDLAVQLANQLRRDDFRVRSNAGHVPIAGQSYYIPDVFVIPTSYTEVLRETGRLETYPGPLPLVVEVWSPSTGHYDVEEKLKQYQRRGDLEIWRIHPNERTLIAWRRQPDGSYIEFRLEGGAVQPVALPGVTVDFNALFE
jgi:Uma2 family endonuclease